MGSANCGVCFRHCRIEEGGLGFCGARTCRDGKVVCANYGRVTSLAMDPIEKKPLARFYPGSFVLSVGSYGCNLRCPFCQNNEISWSDLAMRTAKAAVRQSAGPDGCDDPDDLSGRCDPDDLSSRCEDPGVLHTDYISPEMLAGIAEQYKSSALDDGLAPRRHTDRKTSGGCIGVAFTYNEPLVGYEYVRDTAKLVHEKGMKNVIVTNGTTCLDVLDELAPYVDAMNIDLKGFTDHYYRDVLGGDRKMVMDLIEAAVRICHVELTTLIIPGENDSEEEIAELSGWVAGLDPEIPLHVTRFFPCFHMTDRGPTEVDSVIRLAEAARRNLKYVYTGNI